MAVKNCFHGCYKSNLDKKELTKSIQRKDRKRRLAKTMLVIITEILNKDWNEIAIFFPNYNLK